MENFTPTDAIALQGNRGYNDSMWGGEWFWIIIILFFFGNGWDRNSGLETDIDTRFIERDIFNTNQNVSNTACQTQRDVLTSGCQTQRDVLENRYDLGTQVLENRFNCSQNTASTQKEILQNRYDNALQTNALQSQISTNALQSQMQLAQCCCDLKAESLANTQKILDKMCETEINTLRDRLADRDRDLQTAYNQISQVSQTNSIINQLRPYPIPAYVTASPYTGYGYYGNCGCANTVIA